MAIPLFLARLLVRSGLARHLPAVQRLTDGGAGFLHYYSDRALTAPHAELRDAAALLELHGPEVIDLSLGAPHFDLLPSGSTKLPADRRGWPPPWGLPELRGAVADKLLAERSVAVSPSDEVLITHGAASAFSVTVETFVNAGSRVVLFDPTSPLYSLALRQRRARIRWVPTSVENGRIRFRLDHLDQALRGARLLVLTAPANPTGGVFAAEDLEQVAWWAERHDVLVFNDESFERYCYDGAVPSIGALARAQKRTLTAGSVSKGHALAAARVGWLAGYRHLLRPCAATAVLQTPFVPTLCQQIALAALRQGNDTFAPFRAEFVSRRQYVYERLQALGIEPAWPAGGYFFWLPIGHLGQGGRAFTDQLLRTKRVAVTPGDLFGPSGAGFVRLSYAAEDGRLREGLGRIGEFVHQLQAQREEQRQAA